MKTFRHKFVEYIPEIIEEGILYVSMEHSVAIHLCACGCKNKVVTPLSPTDWELTYDGVSISLFPSIGNWCFDCESHYWITNNKIIYARSWNDKKNKYHRKSKTNDKNYSIKNTLENFFKSLFF